MGEQNRIAVLDIGGTNIKYGIFQDGKITEYHETPTNAKQGGERVMNKMMEILAGLGEFQAVGISTAGQVDVEHGSIIYANENIPGYTGMQIRDRIRQVYQVPVAVGNDVNCAAYGEACFGAGQGEADFLCLTYGTGVGGAILTDSRVYYGATGIAGEFGGILVHPEARNVSEDTFSGCYERYASTTALVKLVHENFPEITNGREIFARIEEPEIFALVDQWIGEIVHGLITLVHILNPSLIVLGGGIMEQSLILEGVQKKLEEQLVPSFRGVRVVQAALGNKAGLLGAAQNAVELSA